MTDGYQVAQQTLAERFWSRLGFGVRHFPRPDDIEGFAPGYAITVVNSRLDWRDRLRVLISGRVRIETHQQTDVLVEKWRSQSVISVLPPAREKRA